MVPVHGDPPFIRVHIRASLEQSILIQNARIVNFRPRGGIPGPPCALPPENPDGRFGSVDISLLKRAPIFEKLEDEELERIAEICQEQEFKLGEVIFKEGDPGNRLFILAEGDVRISRNIPGSGEEALAVLKPGACFGEMAIFDRSHRSTDAIANDRVRCVTIARPDFEMLLDFDREIAYKVLWAVVRLLSDRLRVTNDNLRSFLAMSMF